MHISKIISGGQTGADRGGLIAARLAGIPRGGHCPAGRVAEDGIIPREFELTETTSSGYRERTLLNVQYSDLTAIFVNTQITPGSRMTVTTAEQLHKPFKVFYCGSNSLEKCASDLAFFIEQQPTQELVLNVAGSRESKVPAIERRVAMIILLTLERLTGKLFTAELRACETPVVNRHHLRNLDPPGSIYIGRGTPYGNPYSLTDHTREEALDKFRQLLAGQPALVEQARHQLMRQVLICSCAPKACHGHVWVDMIYANETGPRTPGTWPRW